MMKYTTFNKGLYFILKQNTVKSADTKSEGGEANFHFRLISVLADIIVWNLDFLNYWTQNSVIRNLRLFKFRNKGLKFD